MNHPTKTTSVKSSVKRALLFRRTVAGLGIVACFGLLALAAVFFWKTSADAPFEFPSYEQLDPQSPDYWKDRTLRNIATTKEFDRPESWKEERLRRLTLRDLAEAKRIESNYERITAIADIAMTLARNDTDVNIDDTLRNMEETDFAMSMRARIFVSQALMSLRLKNRSAARVSIMEYNRILVASDLKLDSYVNDMSFCGAVTVFACMDDATALDDLFKKNLAFTLRADPGQQMKAYRFIAGEQARVGFGRNAIETLRRIHDSVEQARACQLIIAFTARPPKIEPTEPEIALPRTEGPWTPLPNPSVARHIVDEVFRYAAEQVEIDAQIRLLARIAGSRLMCDPEIHRLFKTALTEYPGMDDAVKRPVSQLLDEPESEVIRAALNMPPLPPKKAKVVDPALDDWTSPLGSLAVEVADLDPAMMESIGNLQTVRTWIAVAQAYLVASRRREAAEILAKASTAARKQTQPIVRVRDLLGIAEKQISAGDVAGARTTLREIGLPEKQATGDSPDPAPLSHETVFSERHLSELARLQIIGRYFDDADETIGHLVSESIRNEDLAFLATEQIRIGRLDDAERTISKMSDGDSREEFRHRLAVARGGGAGEFRAIGIHDPGPDDGDDRRIQSCNQLIRKGLFETAGHMAESIRDDDSRSKIMIRIAREALFLFNAYRDETPFHRSVRGDLLELILRTLEKSNDLPSRAAVLESSIAAALPFVKTEEHRTALRELIEEASQLVRRSGAPEAHRAELLARLTVSAVAVETIDRRNSAWPLLSRDSNREVFERIKQRIDEVLDLANRSEVVSRRGFALSYLARAAGQVGMTQSAKILIGEAEENAVGLVEHRSSIDILLSLIPVRLSLGEPEEAKNISHRAFRIASETFVASSNDSASLVQWRLRDTELERIVRAQIEYDFLFDAVECAGRINESPFPDLPVIRDRLLQTIAYLYLNRGDYDKAESTARKISVDGFRLQAIRDILFMKRSTASNTASVAE